ncbi:hypothetical protein PO878_04080 [Iamia majanohamensis]|uniref:Uncharacterized protein n=1 Tax=Iamia majanohamensis TaxID=467976 RepID=A0AAE9YHI9_9ACTN|nr:hypothetical protein [Iamia majanohamensis]WCO67901.1 hypothetical protein PO878_04080 [Iamia majanohamensis]
MKTDDGTPLTDEEEKAVRSLRRLAKKWPETLGLFSWSGSLCIVRLDEGVNGRYGMPDAITPNVIGDRLPIVNDGGDPDA